MRPELRGGQAIARACQLLHILEETPNSAGRLTDLATASDMPKATTHRILSVLRDAGFVENISRSAGYALGLDLMRLGAAAGRRIMVRELAAPALVRIAQASGETAYLVVRHGPRAICIDRQRGGDADRALAIEAGADFALGAEAGGLALLAWLPDAVRATADQADAAALQRLVAGARQDDHAFRHTGDGGRTAAATLGVPILDETGQPVAALAVIAAADRLPQPRRADLADLMWREARRIAVRRLGRPAATSHDPRTGAAAP